MKANKFKPLSLSATSTDTSNSLSSPSYIPALALFLIMITSQHLTVVTALGNDTDHAALLAIKNELIDDPEGVLSSWNHSTHHCNWEGVTCGHKHRRVTVLDLHSRSLSGTISPFIGNLSFLMGIFLYNNSLHGEIPSEVSRLLRLRVLSLFHNTISGQIPANISGCINLLELNVENNKLHGKLPRGLGTLSGLKRFSVGYNNFSGPLFKVIGNLTSLEYIYCQANAFTGTIPESIFRMRNLSFLVIGLNELSGILPSSIFNLSSLQTLVLSRCQLHGSLPPDVAFRLPQLTAIDLEENHLFGQFPISITNLTNLEFFSLGNNSFSGLVPHDLGHLPKLQIFRIDANNFGGRLNFIDSLVNCSNLRGLDLGLNEFTGVLPKSLANLSTTLNYIFVDYNQLSGEIPMGIGNLINLGFLTVGANNLIGTIPRDITKLKHLRFLSFSFNRLTGGIPSPFTNFSLLTTLNLDGNKFQGSIPPTIGSCQNLLYLNLSQNDLNGNLPSELFGGSAKFVKVDLSQNHFEGSMPLQIATQTNLVELLVSANKLSGEIPNGLSNCRELQYLNMGGNSFHGNIPPSFTSLGNLIAIDLSLNNLSGPIPDNFSRFPLIYLNLSFNNFEGRVPTDGVFANLSAIFVVGNPKLCGGIPELHLPRCVEKDRKKRRLPPALKLAIPIVCALVGVVILVWLYMIHHTNKRKSVASGSLIGEALLQVSYNMLLKATNGFSSENLLGVGSFGSVFKGNLEPSGKTVAVKVLNLQRRGASKSFMVECKALRNIRHRNLVGIVTACSSTDFQGNDFKALVSEFMPNGSLERWIHEVGTLTLIQRVNTAIDMASALDYLHNGCELPIVHCDLKPSNILFDNNMVAHLADFGIAKFLSEQQNVNQSSSLGVRGTIGYAAPEYGLGGEVSTDGDIYSFGILLLELLTGKRPTDNIFKEDLNLHMYAKAALPDPYQVLQIVDPILAENNDSEKTNDDRRLTQATLEQRAECMVSVVMIGVACSNPLPQDRMKVTVVMSELRRARDIISDARPKRGFQKGS